MAHARKETLENRYPASDAELDAELRALADQPPPDMVTEVTPDMSAGLVKLAKMNPSVRKMLLTSFEQLRNDKYLAGEPQYVIPPAEAQLRAIGKPSLSNTLNTSRTPAQFVAPPQGTLLQSPGQPIGIPDFYTAAPLNEKEVRAGVGKAFPAARRAASLHLENPESWAYVDVVGRPSREAYSVRTPDGIEWGVDPVPPQAGWPKGTVFTPNSSMATHGPITPRQHIPTIDPNRFPLLDIAFARDENIQNMLDRGGSLSKDNDRFGMIYGKRGLRPTKSEGAREMANHEGAVEAYRNYLNGAYTKQDLELDLSRRDLTVEQETAAMTQAMLTKGFEGANDALGYGKGHDELYKYLMGTNRTGAVQTYPKNAPEILDRWGKPMMNNPPGILNKGLSLPSHGLFATYSPEGGMPGAVLKDVQYVSGGKKGELIPTMASENGTNLMDFVAPGWRRSVREAVPDLKTLIPPMGIFDRLDAEKAKGLYYRLGYDKVVVPKGHGQYFAYENPKSYNKGPTLDQYSIEDIQ